MRWIALSLISLSLIQPDADYARAAGSPLPCQTDPACRLHDNRGRELIVQKNYDAALREFEAAYQIQASPALLINIGRCHHRLNNFQKAKEYYQHYRDEIPHADHETDELLRRYEAEARTASAEANAPSAAISSQPSPASDGSPVTTSNSHPIHKRWWFWAALGGVTAGSLAIGLAVGLTPRSHRKITWP